MPPLRPVRRVCFVLLSALGAAPPSAGAQPPPPVARLDVVLSARPTPRPLGLSPDTLGLPLWRPAPVPIPLRTATVVGSGVGAAGYELFRRRVLFPRPTAPFEVEFGWTYARWADKPGHAISTGLQAQAWAAAYRWAGYDARRAALLGAATGFVGMAYYELLDGFDHGVGFDPGDLAANGVGAGLFAARAYSPALDAVHLKWSYWPSGDPCDASCDYEGQTAWLTVNPHALAPEAAKRVLPPWLNVAVGYGAREGAVWSGFEESVVYVGLDFEPAGLPIEGKVWDALVPWLRLVHVPAPALRLSPDVGFEALAY